MLYRAGMNTKRSLKERQNVFIDFHQMHGPATAWMAGGTSLVTA
jgi:hypothetical protein